MGKSLNITIFKFINIVSLVYYLDNTGFLMKYDALIIQKLMYRRPRKAILVTRIMVMPNPCKNKIKKTKKIPVVHQIYNRHLIRRIIMFKC